MASTEERRLIAQVAAHTSWSNTPDRSARTAPARDALMASFERQVDPEGTLPAAERAQRAEHLRKAHFARLALRSAAVRRKARDEREAAAAESA
ncbi:hypothetical protein Acsp06_41580 [Actinomycetospora sp. NBRC 106375]|uniref:hypothetical protein n=1 Tax=Actinomycetospora sp. NBRC 106375 TaxID=3032207 RepID=UPI00249FEFBE|nr:hypothetical protein [Actinomycetospora sp. NBRC 106375]GLZ47973.1 hypothetical protein Acsp06_41580 [Actinomycetospora sp. NBRC 106375]